MNINKLLKPIVGVILVILALPFSFIDLAALFTFVDPLIAIVLLVGFLLLLAYSPIIYMKIKSRRVSDDI
jgi:hypothetical protein